MTPPDPVNPYLRWVGWPVINKAIWVVANNLGLFMTTHPSRHK
jgi:hypothetical protein